MIDRGPGPLIFSFWSCLTSFRSLHNLFSRWEYIGHCTTVGVSISDVYTEALGTRLFFFRWVQRTLLMIFKRAGRAPRPLLLLWGLGWNCEGDAQRWGPSWDGDSSATEGLSLALSILAGLGWVVQGFLLLGGLVGHEVHHPVAVAVFIVIPGNELYKVVIESNASPSIKGGRVGIAVEVARDNLVLSVAQDALQWALRRLLHHLLDVIMHDRFLQVACQIHNRYIGGRNTEGHASEFPIQLWDDLAHSLGSTSGCRDDVLGCPTAIMPQLSRGAIHSLLSGSDGMDCGHEPFHDAKVVMDDLGRGS
ncbi:uncharacterized protein LOC102553444 [Rattus norvegicus]|uniref:uncharacterized protein LOC102553444 n=1 Tax=Rattus norvegicus TaxID=10116 RepID=UPI002FD7BAFF